ncbi:hypothetical protein KJ966_27640 [bacterium]|nr:hypothetical protein [bacterium]
MTTVPGLANSGWQMIGNITNEISPNLKILRLSGLDKRNPADASRGVRFD